MKIFVDITPIHQTSNSQHKIRGVGKYINTLKSSLEIYDKSNHYTFGIYAKTNYKNFDIVHFPYFDPFFITLPLVKKNKTVVTVHDVIPLVHPEHFPAGIKGKIKWKINKKLLENTDAIITDSSVSKENISKFINYKTNKIFPVYLASDSIFKSENYSESKRQEFLNFYGLPEKFILYVGDVTWNKNLPNIVKAVKTAGIPIVMVGKALADQNFDENNPWNRDRLMVAKQILDNKLFFIPGFVPDRDLACFYNFSEALLMPSLDEGFGLPVLEAMNSGCPVITSGSGSLREVAGEAALYVDPSSVDSIVESIKLIFGNHKLKTELREKGFVQGRKFTIDEMIKGNIAVYSKIHNEKISQ